MKKIFDILISFCLIFSFLPFFLLIAVLIRLKLDAPIFFVQARPGLKGKTFTMMKFRSMLDAFDKDGKPLPDEQRMTSFGSFLRKASLDELPGLWNVLKGEMSLVGPRPLLIEYLPLYNEEQKKRHDVRPSITGSAQVSGRNAIS